MLWKSRFPEEELKKLASTMPAHAVAGQYQQRPTAREGGLFKREWFKTVRMIPESATRFMVRAWDWRRAPMARSPTLTGRPAC